MVLPQYYGSLAPILKCQAHRQGKYVFKYVYTVMDLFLRWHLVIWYSRKDNDLELEQVIYRHWKSYWRASMAFMSGFGVLNPILKLTVIKRVEVWPCSARQINFIKTKNSRLSLVALSWKGVQVSSLPPSPARSQLFGHRKQSQNKQ